MELTLVGLVSLILITLQNTINSICGNATPLLGPKPAAAPASALRCTHSACITCALRRSACACTCTHAHSGMRAPARPAVPYSGSTYESWILLGNVRGCDCCLADTSQVGKCFQAARDCGTGFCNCNGVDTCSVGAVRAKLCTGRHTGVCFGRCGRSQGGAINIHNQGTTPAAPRSSGSYPGWAAMCWPIAPHALHCFCAGRRGGAPAAAGWLLGLCGRRGGLPGGVGAGAGP